jgi:hypothetical protein
LKTVESRRSRYSSRDLARENEGAVLAIMSVDPSSVSPDTVLWVAHRIVDQHAEQPQPVEAADPITRKPVQFAPHAAGRCAQCPPDDAPDNPQCPMLAWAKDVIATLEA